MVHPGFNTGLTNTIAGIGKDSLRDFFVEVGMGNIPKYSTVHKFGSASAIAASNFEHIWEGGGETNMTFLSATSSLQVSSSHDTHTTNTTTTHTHTRNTSTQIQPTCVLPRMNDE